MKRRWLKRLLLGMALVVVALAAVAFWLLGTGGGLRLALDRTSILLDGRFGYESARGSLLGGMHLRGLHYIDDEGIQLRIDTVEIAPRSRHLLGGSLHLTAVSAQGVELVLPPASEDEDVALQEGFELELPELRAPLAIHLHQLTVREAVVLDSERVQVLQIDRIEGRASWRGSEIDLAQLDVDTPDGELRVTARIDTGADWDGLAGVHFRWQVPDSENWVSGELDLHGPQSQPSLRLNLSEPSMARIEVDGGPVLGEHDWRLTIRTERFDLAALLDEPPVRLLDLHLDGEGSGSSGQLEGRVGLDDYALAIEQLSASFRDDRLDIDALRVTEIDGSGRVELQAHIDLAGDTPTGHVDGRWSGINPPLDAPFDRLDASGRIEAEGSLEYLQAQIEAEATVDEQPLRLSLQASGDPQQSIRFEPLVVQTGQGRIEAEGELWLDEPLRWQAQVRGRGFDPGLLLPDWPGQVELDAAVEGRVVDETVHAQIDLQRLAGSLRQRPLRGSGRIELVGEQVDADLDLGLGNNRIEIDGRLGERSQAQVRFVLAEPGIVLEQASGQLSGNLRIDGAWPGMHVAGDVQGEGLRYDTIHAERLELEVDAHTDFSQSGRLRLEVSALAIGDESIPRLRLDGDGNADSNRLHLRAQSDRGELDLRLSGRYQADDPSWLGRVEALTVQAPELPAPLRLREPANLYLSASRVELERTCLVAGTGPVTTSDAGALPGGSTGLCLDTRWLADGDTEFGVDLRRLPLVWLPGLGGDATIQADGELGGSGRFRFGADGLQGQATIEGTPGRLHLYGDDEDLLTWSQLGGSIELEGDRQELDLIVQLSPGGRVHAQVRTRPDPELEQTALEGEIAVNLDELRWLELLTPELVQPSGELRGRLQLTGTLDTPGFDGEIALRNFATELPAAGLRLRDSTLSLRGGRGDRIDIEGRFHTASDSVLNLDGWVGLPEENRVPMDLRIQGERVLVADLPVAQVYASPDLRIDANGERLTVRGEVLVPQAMIRPESIEGGVTRASPDVHIVDPDADADDEALATTGLPLHATVLVRLGDRVQIEGYGLQGRLSGQLEVSERPGRTTTGRGEIVVAGSYQAYGQDLDIERGRLIFTGSPIDNPLLDIRAVRRVDAVTAGLAITGNAQRPVLEVYSVPAMDQAEALSYLVLGRPLRQATSSADQDALGTAATAVTTAGGDLLARSLGARLGLDDVGIGTSRELGAGALTLGKYLSPRLYLGYGRSLFDGGQIVFLRYRLTERFELEAQSGTRENKAGINYRLER